MKTEPSMAAPHSPHVVSFVLGGGGGSGVLGSSLKPTGAVYARGGCCGLLAGASGLTGMEAAKARGSAADDGDGPLEWDRSVEGIDAPRGGVDGCEPGERAASANGVELTSGSACDDDPAVDGPVSL